MRVVHLEAAELFLSLRNGESEISFLSLFIQVHLVMACCSCRSGTAQGATGGREALMALVCKHGRGFSCFDALTHAAGAGLAQVRSPVEPVWQVGRSFCISHRNSGEAGVPGPRLAFLVHAWRLVHLVAGAQGIGRSSEREEGASVSRSELEDLCLGRCYHICFYSTPHPRP